MESLVFLSKRKRNKIGDRPRSIPFPLSAQAVLWAPGVLAPDPCGSPFVENPAKIAAASGGEASPTPFLFDAAKKKRFWIPKKKAGAGLDANSPRSRGTLVVIAYSPRTVLPPHSAVFTSRLPDDSILPARGKSNGPSFYPACRRSLCVLLPWCSTHRRLWWSESRPNLYEQKRNLGSFFLSFFVEHLAVWYY